MVALPPSLPTRPQTPPPQLTLNTSAKGSPAPIPNKHLPICSPGPRPTSGLETPPASPPTKQVTIHTTSILSPPDRHTKVSEDPSIYSISAETLAEAIEHVSTQPLPDPKEVFPWLHGLHAENSVQISFFTARRKSARKTPTCLRTLTIVKADGDLTRSKLKGAIAPAELLPANVSEEGKAAFLEADPKEGFSVRNFQIQACKMATVSDIVVYGDDSTPRESVLRLAKRISEAQRAWGDHRDPGGLGDPLFNTYILTGKTS